MDPMRTRVESDLELSPVPKRGQKCQNCKSSNLFFETKNQCRSIIICHPPKNFAKERNQEIADQWDLLYSFQLNSLKILSLLSICLREKHNRTFMIDSTSANVQSTLQSYKCFLNAMFCKTLLRTQAMPYFLGLKISEFTTKLDLFVHKMKLPRYVHRDN